MFLQAAPHDIAAKSYLYLHTSHPDKNGWDITSLINEMGLGSKVICTYFCQFCKKKFSAFYRDAITVCNHCGNRAAKLAGVGHGLEHHELVDIYNVMDVYVQYAITEGFGMPQVEAASCGVPIMSINYSAMEDVVTNTGGFPIKANLQREIETNADRSVANNEDLVINLLIISI
jgi:glycosyltransferase involved in cell wall biosynthesis